FQIHHHSSVSVKGNGFILFSNQSSLNMDIILVLFYSLMCLGRLYAP
ncbi:hypothetical protein LINGRAHAP2_LOCUS9540, partial [Linum grandiflorum]